MIDISSIMGKAQKFAESPEGKKRMSEHIAERRKSGKTSASGQRILNEDDMKHLADILCVIIKKHLPDSIVSAADALRAGSPEQTRHDADYYRIDLKFDTDAIRRDSLYSDGYAGVDNIVALLNNGYTASNYVYGTWHSVYIRSMKEREGLNFMQNAIAEFETRYGEKYNVTAVLGDEYTE